MQGPEERFEIPLNERYVYPLWARVGALVLFAGLALALLPVIATLLLAGWVAKGIQ